MAQVPPFIIKAASLTKDILGHKYMNTGLQSCSQLTVQHRVNTQGTGKGQSLD